MTDCPQLERTYQRPMDPVGEAAQPLTESQLRFATLCAAVQLRSRSWAAIIRSRGMQGRHELHSMCWCFPIAKLAMTNSSMPF